MLSATAIIMAMAIATGMAGIAMVTVMDIATGPIAMATGIGTTIITTTISAVIVEPAPLIVK